MSSEQEIMNEEISTDGVWESVRLRSDGRKYRELIALLSDHATVEELAQAVRCTDIGNLPNAHEYLEGSRQLAQAALSTIRKLAGV